MLRRKQQGAMDGFGGFLTEGTEVEGEVRFNEELRVDGKIIGRIYSAKGRVLVGENGYVDGEVEVGTASISGTIAGTLRASVKVEIHSTGRFYGNIYAPALIIEEGAIFEGHCEMANGVERSPSHADDAKAVAESAAGAS